LKFEISNLKLSSSASLSVLCASAVSFNAHYAQDYLGTGSPGLTTRIQWSVNL
jgi:hypothetical protein